MITEVMCGPDHTYLLEDNGLFLHTEYRVLQNQPAEHFVRCMRMLNNGKIQLYYATGGYKPLDALLAELDHRKVLSVVESLLAGVLEIRGNGFLECQNLDVSPERIFVDTAVWQAKLMYFPLARHQFDSYAAFEGKLRDTLQQLLSRPDLQVQPETMALSIDLSGGRMPLEELYKKYRRERQQEEPYKMQSRQSLRIVSLSSRTPFDLYVTKDRFTVGRDRADGQIPFADTISAPHCEIRWDGSRYTVTDLGSTNGTYLNRQRVAAQQAAPLKNGDVLRLADCDFRIVVG